MKASDCRLGDVVRVIEGPYCDSTVVDIIDRVYLFRPYVHISDFEYTGGVIPYIGIENFDVSFDTAVTLVHRPSQRR